MTDMICVGTGILEFEAIFQKLSGELIIIDLIENPGHIQHGRSLQ